MSKRRRKARPGKAAGKADGRRQVAVNKKALFKFQLIEKVEAGMELTGTEVKSLRERNVSFTDSYAQFRGGNLYLYNLNIARYEPGSFANHEPTRPRRLLLHRRELDKLMPRLQQKGHTLVPIAIYFRGGWAKVELALVTAKTAGDKRRTIRERETRRDMDRARKLRGRG